MWRKYLSEFGKFIIVFLLTNFISFTYSFDRYIRFSAVEHYEYSLIPSYFSHLKNFWQNNLGTFPGSTELVLDRITSSIAASMGLLFIVIVICVVLGILLGFLGTSISPPRVRTWMTVLSSFAYSMPGFFLGSLIITITIYYLIWQGPEQGSVIPIQGFGWDLHLVYPVFVLAFRPTLQIAQITSNAITTELSKQYVLAARSLGYSWKLIVRKSVFRNIIVSISLAITSNFRLLIGQLVIIEWMFRWPGLGRLLVLVMMPSVSYLGSSSYLLLYPPLVSSVISLFAILIYSSALIHKALSWIADPRIRQSDNKWGAA